jgi:hypothetical protein
MNTPDWPERYSDLGSVELFGGRGELPLQVANNDFVRELERRYALEMDTPNVLAPLMEEVK